METTREEQLDHSQNTILSGVYNVQNNNKFKGLYLQPVQTTRNLQKFINQTHGSHLRNYSSNSIMNSNRQQQRSFIPSSVNLNFINQSLYQQLKENRKELLRNQRQLLSLQKSTKRALTSHKSIGLNSNGTYGTNPENSLKIRTRNEYSIDRSQELSEHHHYFKKTEPARQSYQSVDSQALLLQTDLNISHTQDQKSEDLSQIENQESAQDNSRRRDPNSLKNRNRGSMRNVNKIENNLKPEQNNTFQDSLNVLQDQQEQFRLHIRATSRINKPLIKPQYQLQISRDQTKNNTKQNQTHNQDGQFSNTMKIQSNSKINVNQSYDQALQIVESKEQLNVKGSIANTNSIKNRNADIGFPSTMRVKNDQARTNLRLVQIEEDESGPAIQDKNIKTSPRITKFGVRKNETSRFERQHSNVSGTDKSDNISSEQRFMKLMKFDIDFEFDKINKMMIKQKQQSQHQVTSQNSHYQQSNNDSNRNRQQTQASRRVRFEIQSSPQQKSSYKEQDNQIMSQPDT
ncbi:UNKNOWN [Stylonychia lemnae]|uniref:Uncharacterized protein n=1 Tax=Stylonychia lemnae TaxID=5949 RepID=A0A078ADL4_STYLE|nr:UNKNOWN [Stylonychia lemnae]|eukprot:CDW78973.1 UNKNOWN [Stylonychia lemnae]